jgi:DNA gyrase subunit A
MEPFAKEVTPVTIEDEMKQSYLDYAMSVIVGRALPDVRDGLKPVHRRVLYAMRELGLDWNRAYKKSARLVGEVIGKYHPHGESAVYDTIVRMAQPFSLRYPLVDGQGNFGSVDGDPPAAMRYTEIRMARMAHDLLADLDKETVDFAPNYDGSEREPLVLPTRVPNLLVNGAAGIAVGMATNVPPHNLREIVDACLALIQDPDIAVEALIEHVPGPDFPTAGIINGADGIEQAYRTGRGAIQVRARAHIEEEDGKHTIVVTELPYQVNKARLLERIAELVKDRKIEGINELRDESDKDGMRMIIGLRRGEVPQVVLNNLFLHTQMQATFGINMVALVGGQPMLLGLKEVLEAFLRHRREVVTRRTVFELRKARERAHILEGLAVALANIDPIIALIRQARTPADAKQGLMGRAWPPGAVVEMLQRSGAQMSRPADLSAEYGLAEDGYRLSEAQAQAILDLRLQRLTALEQDKIFEEYRNLLDTIAALLDILNKPGRLMEVIRDELNEVREQYGDARRTEIIRQAREFSVEDLISEEEVVVTLSHAGYVKTQPLSLYHAQRRGGKGKTATSIKEEDFIERLLVTSSHDTLLCFSSYGKVYWLKVYDLPQGGRTARGRPIVNLLPLEDGESIHGLLPLKQDSGHRYVFMVTAGGTVKKTPIEEFSRPRSSGIIALELDQGDRLVGADFTDGARHVMLFSNAGKAVRFEETDVRPMGRTARGVRGMRLAREERVIALIIVREGHVLSATENGYGKRTLVGEYPVHGRGGQGVISIRTSARNGKVVGAVAVAGEDELMLISDQGTLVRLRAADVSVMGRSTQGVKLVALARGEKLVGLERVVDLERL